MIDKDVVKEVKEIKQTPNDFIKMIVLNKREFANESIYLYLREKNKGGNPPIYQVKTAIQNLFVEIECSIQEELSKEEYDDLNSMINCNDEVLIFKAWDIINHWLYKKDLTRIFRKRRLL